MYPPECFQGKSRDYADHVVGGVIIYTFWTIQCIPLFCPFIWFLLELLPVSKSLWYLRLDYLSSTDLDHQPHVFLSGKFLLENESQKPQRESAASNASAANFKNDEFSPSSLKVTKYSIF